VSAFAAELAPRRKIPIAMDKETILVLPALIFLPYDVLSSPRKAPLVERQVAGFPVAGELMSVAAWDRVPVSRIQGAPVAVVLI
jgi:hypothetical protein